MDGYDLVGAGRLQRKLCLDNGSPTYAGCVDVMLDQLADGGPAADLLRSDGQDPVQTAVYLRLLGAVHRDALRDPSHPLRPYLPSAGGSVDPAPAVEAFRTVIASRTAQIAADMPTTIQTNEVGRSAPLSAAMNVIAGPERRPLRLWEVGASAGLNLLPDRYHVDAGDRSWGPQNSPVRLVGHFTAGRPPAGELRIESRAGCDLNPLDPRSTAHRDLLRSFIWPEHTERLRRLDAALRVARDEAAFPVVEACDAVTWIERRLAERHAGSSVIFHSIMLTYLPAGDRARFAHAIRSAGDQADDDHRLAWISYETDDSGAVWLDCETWPGGERTRLAGGSPHGTRVRWEPRPLTARA